MKQIIQDLKKGDIIAFLVAHNEFKSIGVINGKIVLDFCGINK
jgi:UDP-N-acetyl-D-mannosaminuronic acid dehydrogenase